MEKLHHYSANIQWTGNKGTGTSGYAAYDRSHTVSIEGKPAILASSDTPFRGDGTKHNPEDFLLSALSSCHMLWYLHLCSDAGIIVVDYVDNATGILSETAGRFAEVTLNPVVTITDASQIDKANALHTEANKKCFIANSCNFPVKHQPRCISE